MPARRPEIFVSATSADLRTCRQMVKEALLTLGCVPVEQTNFPPDYRTVREMLRARIAACDAVIHLAGDCHGAEPRVRAPGEPRRSYTQLEYDLARELRKPLYIFLCGDDFPYDEHAPEDAEKQELQRAHRAAVAGAETLRTRIHTRDELALKVRELQTNVEQLTRELAKTRSWLGRGVAIGLIALAVGGASLWLLRERAARSERHAAAMAEELAALRRDLQAVVARYAEQTGVATRLTDEEQYQRAVAIVAAQLQVEPATLATRLQGFAAQVRTAPGADPYDRALAAFAERNYEAAAAHALRAAELARASSSHERERDALTLAGTAYAGLTQFSDAASAYTRAFGLVDAGRDSAVAGRLQFLLGNAHQALASRGGADADAQAEASVAAYRAALTLFPAETAALPRAHTQNNLGVALHIRARQQAGRERARLLVEAVDILREALTVRTRPDHPHEWAATQNNLGNTLSVLAELEPPPQGIAHLTEAAACYHAALEIFTRDADPPGWAMAQINLSSTLTALAAADEGRAANLLDEAVAAARGALEVATRATAPLDWALAQHNLGSALWAQATVGSPAQWATRLGEAVDAFYAALEIYVRDTNPREWAAAQSSLGGALSALAGATEGPAKKQLLDQAVRALRAVLEVRTRERQPLEWAKTQSGLAFALQDRALASTGPARHDALIEAVAAYRAVLEVFTADAFPAQHRYMSDQLAQADALLQAEKD